MGPGERRRAQSKLESGFGWSAVENARGYVLANCGAVLEAVTGAATDYPAIFPIGVAIDQEIGICRVFVLADARFGERGIGEIGETLGQEAAGVCEGVLVEEAIARIRIEGGAAFIEG